MGRAIGIDLGTTYSAVSIVNDFGKPEILPNREGEAITASVVLFQGDMPLVGSMAKRAAATDPDNVVQFVKRQMGNPAWSFDAPGGKSYRPEEVSALILKRLKDDAEMVLGEPVTDAVITVPAYFDDANRRATIDAGTMAGLNVLRVLNEPTAAAIAYGVANDSDGTFLVFDLGGGTFDVTVLKSDNDNYEVLATDGDKNLGGFDWDNEIMRYVSKEFEAETGTNLLDDDAASADLRDKAEIAKRTLTSVGKANIMISHGGHSKVIPITREEFQELTAGLLSRAEFLTNDVLEQADLKWDEITHVLLVGGSTRMPMIREMVERISGKKPERNLNPDEIVAMGAAIQASISVTETGSGSGNTDSASDAGAAAAAPVPGLAGITVKDVTSQSLGIIALDDDHKEINSIIISRNSPIPLQESGVYLTLQNNQTRFKVTVTEGDDSDPDFVNSLGEQVLPIAPYPKGAKFEVTYSYDVDQVVHVGVVDLQTNLPVGNFEVENKANMSRDAVAVSAQGLSRVEVL